ncbi:trypsin-like peptidase domain-containing protein [Pseudonocardia kunmingensis]
MLAGDTLVARGTGFVVVTDAQPFLITNRHNLIGRDSDNEPLGNGRIPTRVGIWHSAVTTDSIGWTQRTEELYFEPGSPRWLEHPQHGRRVDVVALPLHSADGLQLRPYNPAASNPSFVNMEVSADVFIVGFPFNLAAGGRLAIWSRGTVATDPIIDYDGLPQFLVDSRTRQGQSGSPVIHWSQASGTTRHPDGSVSMGYSPPTATLLGVYSGRVNKESDLGRVWKPQVIAEIIRGQMNPTGESLASG